VFASEGCSYWLSGVKAMTDRQTDRQTYTQTTKGFPDFTAQDGGPNSLLCSALLGESEVGGTGAVSIGGRDWWCSGGGGGAAAAAAAWCKGLFLANSGVGKARANEGLGAELTGQEASARMWKQKISRSRSRRSGVEVQNDTPDSSSENDNC
jgi:hypothetical protein